MNQSPKINKANATPAFTWQAKDCETCGGEGTIPEFRNYAGEAVAGEFHDETCTDCDGTGEEDATCECGEASPLNDDGLCADCVLPAEPDPNNARKWL